MLWITKDHIMMPYLFKPRFTRLSKHSLGQALVEYTIIGALVLLVAIPVLQLLAGSLGEEIATENQVISGQGSVSTGMPTSVGLAPQQGSTAGDDGEEGCNDGSEPDMWCYCSCSWNNPPGPDPPP